MTTPMMLVGQVRTEARRIDPGKTLLTVLALLPFLLGWVAGVTVRGCWAALLWARAAIVVGWRTAYGHADGGG